MSRKSIKAQQIHAHLRKIEQKANVAGYVVLDASGEHIGTIRFSYPRDGAGRIQALAANWAAERPMAADSLADFPNWTPWQYGWAGGGGYDKATAALGGMTIGTVTLQDQGYDWCSQLRKAGYHIIQGV